MFHLLCIYKTYLCIYWNMERIQQGRGNPHDIHSCVEASSSKSSQKNTYTVRGLVCTGIRRI